LVLTLPGKKALKLMGPTLDQAGAARPQVTQFDNGIVEMLGAVRPLLLPKRNTLRRAADLDAIKRKIGTRPDLQFLRGAARKQVAARAGRRASSAAGIKAGEFGDR
jgi:hypothetical protein